MYYLIIHLPLCTLHPKYEIRNFSKRQNCVDFLPYCPASDGTPSRLNVLSGSPIFYTNAPYIMLASSNVRYNNR